MYACAALGVPVLNWDDLRARGAFEPSEIVVAISHMRSVLKELDDIGASHIALDHDRVLGLSRVRITGFSDDLSRGIEHELQQKNASRDPTRQEYQPVDVLLEMLRTTFKKNYHFSPAMGKNRTLAQVGDLHNIG